MFGLFFSGGCSILPFLCFLYIEKLLDLLYKDLHQPWKVFQCLQKRLAFFFEPVIPFLQSFHGRGRIEILPLIVGNAAFQILDFAAACDDLLDRTSQGFVLAAFRPQDFFSDGGDCHDVQVVVVDRLPSSSDTALLISSACITADTMFSLP